MRASWAALMCIAGCQATGAVQLALDLPSDSALAPQGMTSITVVADGSAGTLATNTSELDDHTFTAGQLPIGDDIAVSVELRDPTGRLVGVGEAANPVDISATSTTKIDIPVRRPFVYAADGTNVYSFDPTLDARSSDFQGQLSGGSSPVVVISAGGDRLAIVSSQAVQAIDTSTNQTVGKPVALPATASDAAPIGNSHRIAVATTAGISIIDLDAGTIASAGVSGGVDRVSVGVDSSGALTAFGLVGRVAPAFAPFDDCSGSTQLVTVVVDSPADATPADTGVALSGIAADPITGSVFATAPCTGKVETIANGALSDFATLERAAAVAVQGGRVWAVGSHAATGSCYNPESTNGDPVSCSQSTSLSCPLEDSSTTNQLALTATGANLIVISKPTAGSDVSIEFDVPARTEAMVDSDPENEDPQLAEQLPAYALEPLDLVAVPGGQFVSIVAKSQYFITGFTDDNGNFLPCMDATTGDWLLIDMTNLTIADRVRTQCNVEFHDAGAEFPTWDCGDTDPQESPQFGGTNGYQPTSVGALFGAR